MNTLPMTTSSLKDIASCWLYQDRLYKYVEHGRIVSLLPKVSINHKSLLDDLGVSYRKDNIGLSYEIWDPTCYAEQSLTLPLYLQVEKSFRWIKKYTGTVVTHETTVAAFALYKRMIKPKLKEIEEEEKQKTLISVLMESLNGNAARGLNAAVNSILRPYASQEKDVIRGNIHIKLLPVHTLMSEKKRLELQEAYEAQGMNPSTINTVLTTDYVAIFDMSKMSTGKTVDLYVPGGTEPIFVGRGGWQVKQWCEQLGGLLKINVKAVQ